MSAATLALTRSHLRLGDIVGIGLLGLRVKRMRALLTGLGIAIGIAAMVGVVGISASSRADLLAELDALGTNFLQVQPGSNLSGQTADLPTTAPEMIRRFADVEAATATRTVENTTVWRNDLTPSYETASRSWPPSPACSRHPGRDRRPRHVPQRGHGDLSQRGVGVGGRRPRGHQLPRGRALRVPGPPAVPGDRHPRRHALAPDIDRAALIGWGVAQRQFGIDATPTTVRVRTDPDRTEAVSQVLGATANPESPNQVAVSRPSDALEARSGGLRGF